MGKFRLRVTAAAKSSVLPKDTGFPQFSKSIALKKIAEMKSAFLLKSQVFVFHTFEFSCIRTVSSWIQMLVKAAYCRSKAVWPTRIFQSLAKGVKNLRSFSWNTQTTSGLKKTKNQRWNFQKFHVLQLTGLATASKRIDSVRLSDSDFGCNKSGSFALQTELGPES